MILAGKLLLYKYLRNVFLPCEEGEMSAGQRGKNK